MSNLIGTPATKQSVKRYSIGMVEVRHQLAETCSIYEYTHGINHEVHLTNYSESSLPNLGIRSKVLFSDAFQYTTH